MIYNNNNKFTNLYSNKVEKIMYEKLSLILLSETKKY